jgi:tetratricopeptide (TPR) repeat protein
MKREKMFVLVPALFVLASAAGSGNVFAQDKYVDVLENLTTVHPDSVKKYQENDLARLLKKGAALYQEGALPSAILAYQDLLKADPKNRTALLQLGKIALETKNWAYALSTISRLAALDPNDYETRLILMEIYYTYEEPLQEMRTASELLRLAPDDKSLHEMFLEQINVLERLTKLSPSEPKYLNQLADLYSNQNNLPKTISTYERLRKLRPGDTKVLKRLARLYGEAGEVGKQIAAYEAVLKIEKDNEPVQNALVLAYGDALKDPELPLNARAAGRNVQTFGANSSQPEYIRDISTALQVASYPEVTFTTTRRTYNFNGKKEHVEGIASIALRGFNSNSAFLAEQSIITLDASKEPELLRNAKLLRMDEARLYRTTLTWQQKVGNFRLDLSPGIIGLISASSGIDSFATDFVGEVSLKYKFSKKLLLSGNYDLDYITLTPLAIQRGINRHRVQLAVEWVPWERLQWSTSIGAQDYSDNNQGKQFSSGLSLDVVKTKRRHDLESYESLDFDETGMQISIGADYEYFDFDKESEIYPTPGAERDPLTLKLRHGEHVYSGSILVAGQLFPSFFLKQQGFYGRDNRDRTLWGFDISMEKQLNWRLNVYAGYEISKTPLFLDEQNVNVIDEEGRLYIGIGSKL